MESTFYSNTLAYASLSDENDGVDDDVWLVQPIHDAPRHLINRNLTHVLLLHVSVTWHICGSVQHLNDSEHV